MKRGESEIVTPNTNDRWSWQKLVQGEEPKLLSVKRASPILNVSTHCLYRKIREGAIPAFRCGRKVLIDLQEVKEAMRVKIGNPHNGAK